ncbi:MAG: transglycosylase SLT domain-containing protein [Luteibaculum sp.]
MKKLYTLFILLIFVFACNNPGKDSSQHQLSELATDESSIVERDLPKIKERDTLVALTGYNSLSYFIYRGATMGYEYDLLKRLAQDLNVHLKVKVVEDLSQPEKLLNTGEGDILAHNLTITNERKKELAFSAPLTQTQQVLVQLKPSGWKQLKPHQLDRKLVRTPLQLEGETLLVRQNSAYQSRLENLKEESGLDFHIKQVEGTTSTEYLIKRVAKGEIPFTVADENIANVSTAFYPNIDVKTPLSLKQNVAWAFRKNAPKLKEAVDDWLKEMQAGSDYYVIYNKYFKHKRSVAKKVQSPLYARNSGVISEYDPIIKEQSQHLNWDWRLVAALVYQESKFDAEAQSWAGAKGLMQMMPKTAEKFEVENLFNPEENIQAGVAYLKELESFWTKKIPDEIERKKFVMASYNVGFGHVLDAQRLAEKYGKDPLKWDKQVAPFLRKKSKPEYYNDDVVKYGFCRGEEPYKYVKQIFDRYEHYARFTEPVNEENVLAMN